MYENCETYSSLVQNEYAEDHESDKRRQVGLDLNKVVLQKLGCCLVHLFLFYPGIYLFRPSVSRVSLVIASSFLFGIE